MRSCFFVWVSLLFTLNVLLNVLCLVPFLFTVVILLFFFPLVPLFVYSGYLMCLVCVPFFLFTVVIECVLLGSLVCLLWSFNVLFGCPFSLLWLFSMLCLSPLFGYILGQSHHHPPPSIFMLWTRCPDSLVRAAIRARCTPPPNLLLLAHLLQKADCILHVLHVPWALIIHVHLREPSCTCKLCDL